MEHFKQPNALCLEGNLAENWKEWIQAFELYLTATGIEEKSGKIKVATFLHVAGLEARRVYNTMTFAEGENVKLDKVTEKFKNYCEPRKNLTYTRHVFFTRNQSAQESIDVYVTDLKNKAQQCEFGDLANSLIRDKIVCGIHSESCRARLLREADLTLEKAIDVCRASEISSQQLKTLKNDDHAASVPVHKVDKKRAKPGKGGKKKQAHATKGPGRQETVRSGQDKCQYCARTHEKGKCPAYGQKCHKCKRHNHFAVCCGRTVHVVEDDYSDEELFVGTIQIDSVQRDWTEKLTINGENIEFKLDTGAQANILPKRVYTQLKMSNRKLMRTSTKLYTYNGGQIVPLGTVVLDCKFRDRTFSIPFFVVDIQANPILGNKACGDIGAIMRVHAVETTLNKEDVLSEFRDVFEGLGKIPGTYHIEIDKTVEPVVHPPRKVPAAIKDEVYTELHRMETMGVIVKQDEPTDWVNSMITVRKPGKTRVCLDPKNLNEALKREHFPMTTVDDIVERLPRAKVFSRFDATHGFWQIALDEESSKLLTFNTPFGRYRYQRLPFGISTASEVFSKRVQELFTDLEGVECIVDDILVWGETEAQHDKRVRQMLQRCREKNFKLNKKKFELKVPEVKYVGHVLGQEGLKVDPDKVRALVEMPAPEDVQGVKRFLGAVQYVGKFVPNLSEVTAPLRVLLQGDVQWHWQAEQQSSFDRLKSLISSAPVLKFYDVTQPVTISVDASSKGLGVVLLQDGHPVAYGSRALTEAQQRYAQIERELLAVVYGCEKFHHYIYGRSVVIETDHKPLVAIHSKPIFTATPRLQRMLMKLQRYDIELVYVPGKLMFISDALSRAYLDETRESLVDEEFDVNSLEVQLPVSPAKLKEIKDATLADEALSTLISTVVNGWPEEKSSLPKEIGEFWCYRDEITVIDGLLYKNHRLIIPKTLRGEMLLKLHESHLGIVKTKQRARELLYWPGMNGDIQQMISRCEVCNKFAKSNSKEPLISHEIPSGPWMKVAADLFQFKDAEYLLCVDYYSKYPEIVLLHNETTSTVVTAFKSVFARHGIPREVFTDNGPCFSSASFSEFARDWDFMHSTSSPLYARSNGQAERCVQTVKNLLKKADESGNDVYIALLEYRASPIDGVGLSPAQLLMNRQVKTKLPIASHLLKPKLVGSQQKNLVARQKLQKSNHDKQAVPLPDLQKGDIVHMQRDRQWEPAIVADKHSNRSFIIQTGSGRQYRRNRRALRKTPHARVPEKPDPDEIQETLMSSGDRTSLQPDGYQSRAESDDTPMNTAADVPNDMTITRSGRMSRKPAYLQKDYVSE